MKQKDHKKGNGLLPEKTGYSVPEGYFDKLADRITQSVGIEGFDSNDVPDNYFEELPDRIIDIVEKEHVTPMIVPLSGWKKYVAIAASLILLVTGYNYFNGTSGDMEDVVASDALILEYLSEYDIDIETATLSQLEVIRNEFNMTDVVEESDELYEYYLEYYIDDLPANELEEIIK